MDFVQVAGPLGVTHFVIVSRTDSHVNLRLCRLPRGPTLTFHITNVGGKSWGIKFEFAIKGIPLPFNLW